MCQIPWQRGSLLVGLRQFSTLRKRVTFRCPSTCSSSFGHATPLQKTMIPKLEPTRLPARQIWCFFPKCSTYRSRTVGSIALSSSLPLCKPLQSFGTAQPSSMIHLLRRWRRRADAFARLSCGPSAAPGSSRAGPRWQSNSISVCVRLRIAEIL